MPPTSGSASPSTAGKKVVGVILVGLLLVGAWLVIDHLNGPDCGDFLGMSPMKKTAETRKVLERSGIGSETVQEWVPELESYCRANRGDNLKDLEATSSWGLGW